MRKIRTNRKIPKKVFEELLDHEDRKQNVELSIVAGSWGDSFPSASILSGKWGGEGFVRVSQEVFGWETWMGERWPRRFGKMARWQGLSVASAYAVVKFPPALVICWIFKEGREMAGLILGRSFAGHLLQKATGPEEICKVAKVRIRGWAWIGKGVNWGGQLSQSGRNEGVIRP